MSFEEPLPRCLILSYVFCFIYLIDVFLANYVKKTHCAASNRFRNYLIETIKNISSRASGKSLEIDKTVASKASWKLFGNANAIAAASPCFHSISVLMPLMHLHVNVYGRSMQSQVNN